MKTCFTLWFCLAAAALARADEPAATPVAPDAPTAPTVADTDRLTPAQLEQLVGPIALYPDALVALILPAATAPADIVLAARYLKDNGEPAEVANRSWDESVKSLVHYAAVVQWMDDNLTWTKQLGEAFRDQPAEVMQAIQRLRAKARAAGTLQDSPQQQVLVDGDAIAIVPAQPQYLYVPYYDPAIVYAPPPDYGTTTFISFSSPFATGAWLAFDCDWHHRAVWVADRHRWASRDNHDWRHPVFPGQPGYSRDPNRHPWSPPPTAPRMPVVNVYRHETIPQPAPINAAARPGFTTNNVNLANLRNDSRDQPARTSSRPRDPNFVGPVIATTPAPVAPVPPPTHHNDGDRPNRSIAFQNPPGSRPAQAAPAPNPAPPPVSSYQPSVPPPARVAPAFVGPVTASAPAPVASQPQHLHLPAAAPAPAPAPPPAAPPAAAPVDNKRSSDGDQKKQLN